MLLSTFPCLFLTITGGFFRKPPVIVIHLHRSTVRIGHLKHSGFLLPVLCHKSTLKLTAAFVILTGTKLPFEALHPYQKMSPDSFQRIHRGHNSDSLPQSQSHPPRKILRTFFAHFSVFAVTVCHIRRYGRMIGVIAFFQWVNADHINIVCPAKTQLCHTGQSSFGKKLCRSIRSDTIQVYYFALP